MANTQTFALEGGKFRYPGTAIKFESHELADHSYSASWPKLWVIIMREGNTWGQLKESLIAFYATRKKYPDRLIRVNPESTTGGGFVTFESDWIRNTSVEKRAWLDKMALTRFDISKDVVFQWYNPSDCDICHDLLELRVKTTEWEIEKCERCPGYNDEEDIRRCMPCILDLRTRRLKINFEPHERDKFWCDWSRLAEESTQPPSLSAFAKHLSDMIGTTWFCVASTITMVALFKQYVHAFLGQENNYLSTQVLFRVSR